jgi:hypothetical protein
MTPPMPLRFAILASLGVLHGCPSSAIEPATDPDPVLEQAEGLAAEKDWKRCLTTWQQGSEAAFGGEPYPFTEKGKAKLVEQLENSRGLVKGLEGQGLLTATEAGLLDQDISILLAGVYAKRAKEMEMATCYEPMMYTPRRDALQALAPRVELLEGLAAQEVLQPEVVVRVLEQVRRELPKLAEPGGVGMNPDELAQAEEVERRVTAALATIDHRLSSPHDGPGPDTPQPVDPASIIPEATSGE